MLFREVIQGDRHFFRLGRFCRALGLAGFLAGGWMKRRFLRRGLWRQLRPMDEPLTADFLIACFEDAAATLAALPAGGYSTRMAVTFREIAADPDAPPSTDFRDRPARPSAAKIDAMDIIFSWLAIIPEKQKTLRRIVALRSMLNRAGDPPSWRGIANRVRADHRAVARWHAQGIAMICNELNRRAGHATADDVFRKRA